MINVLVILLAFQSLQSFASSNDNNNNQTILFGYTINEYKNTGNKYELRNLLSTFYTHAKNTEFYNSTVFSRSPNRNNLYGLYMCRGDIDSELCRVCIKYAINTIVMRQSYGKEGMFWYDHCMLRYSNQPFIGKLDNNTHTWSTWENVNTTNNPACFTNTLQYTISLLAVQAAGSSKKFGTKIVKFKEGETLYTLVQCTPDLTANDCRKCLTKSIEQVREMGASKGGKVIQLNCMVRYEMFPFFYTDRIKSFDSTGINSTAITLRVQFGAVPRYNDSVNSTSSSSSSVRSGSPMILKFKGYIGTSTIDNSTIKATLCFPSAVVSNSTIIKNDGSKIGDISE